MFKKNFIIAIRSLKRNRSYTSANIIGLTIGITCSLLICSFVYYEMSFDTFHKKQDRIYRVNYDVLMGAKETVSPSVPVFVAPQLKKRFPEVEDVTRFLPGWYPQTIRRGNVFFDEKGFAYADPNFFKLFDFKPVSGNLGMALSDPNTLVITKEIAKKYFGQEDPVGKTLLLNNDKEFTVRAVIQNVPSNSHFNFDFVTSLYSVRGFDSLETREIWNNPNYTTFLLLRPGVDVAMLSHKIDKWVNPDQKSETTTDNVTYLQLEPLKDVHFNTHVFNFKDTFVVTDPKYITVFITIAVLVLLIACSNYINLATAKASSRGKEVGIRKAIGAGFWQLFFQFLTESFLLVIAAMLISVIATSLLLPYVNNILGKTVPFYLFDIKFLSGIIAATVIISLLAGFYPAFLLSGYGAVESLKGEFEKMGKSGISVRRSLVVLQFVISITLILGAIVVRSQLQFMQSEKLGFDKEHVLIIYGNADIHKSLPAFETTLKKITGVQDASLTWRSPFETVTGNGFSIKANPTSENDWHVVGGIAGDDHYLPTLGIPLLAGRNFDPAKIKGDSTVNEFIVNEAFLRHYRLQAKDVIGKEVQLGLAGKGPIVGVMKDFHTSSMHNEIQPVVLFNRPDYFGEVLLKIAPGSLPGILKSIEELWKSFSPSRPFSYSFLDEEYSVKYKAEQRLSFMMSVFCGVAILITCLGLLGLMAFIVARRTKEIGIRKVLGASLLNITSLLSKDFLMLVVIAIVIAMPISWYFMHSWLQDFAYRIHIGWWVFAVAAILGLLIAIITVSSQAIKAAMANPVKSLRTE